MKAGCFFRYPATCQLPVPFLYLAVIALLRETALRFSMASAGSSLRHCAGCGQLASPEHLGRRLHRLECATRYRPIHIQTLLLGCISPANDSDFLYSPEGRFEGEAQKLLEAVRLSWEGKSADTVLAEFQKRGLMLTHLLECPAEPGLSDSQTAQVLEAHLPRTIARLRRSFKPRRIILINADWLQVLGTLQNAHLGCPVFPASSSPFFLEGSPGVIDFNSAGPAVAGRDGA